MSKYIMRLDDAYEKRDVEKWDKIEKILDKYNIKPLVGVIPHCEDNKMDKYKFDNEFWDRVHSWQNKGWTIAMHGFNHVYSTEDGGINPVNRRSEFAGNSLEIQKQKIKSGWEIFLSNGLEPDVFFAPSHTFDKNTLKALKSETSIRVISDTVAYDVYRADDFIFVPQQSGKARRLPFKTVTFCYHPNMMQIKDFDYLETFLKENQSKFIAFTFKYNESIRYKNSLDSLLEYLYFYRKR